MFPWLLRVLFTLLFTPYVFIAVFNTGLRETFTTFCPRARPLLFCIFIFYYFIMLFDYAFYSWKFSWDFVNSCSDIESSRTTDRTDNNAVATDIDALVAGPQTLSLTDFLVSSLSKSKFPRNTRICNTCYGNR